MNRPVLPAIADTLLVDDKFRSAVMALCREPSQTLSGHEADGSPSKDHGHAFWWPLDEDNDGFIDHVIVWAPGGFEQREIDALRRLTRLRQRGGRPDLLVTPVIVGQADDYQPWTGKQDGEEDKLAKVLFPPRRTSVRFTSRMVAGSQVAFGRLNVRS